MKKPSVFVNKIEHDLKNNEKVFSSYGKESVEFRSDLSEKDVRKKLYDIFNSPKYVYKADTIIKTNKGILEKTIVGMNKDKLLTMDNETINISDILDINLKD